MASKIRILFLDHIPNDFLKHFTEDKILPYINIKPDCILFPKVNIRPVTYQPNMKKHFYLGLPHQKEEVFNVLKSVIMIVIMNIFKHLKNLRIIHLCIAATHL